MCFLNCILSLVYIQNDWELQLFKIYENKSHIYVPFPLTSQENLSLFVVETQVLQASWKREKKGELNQVFKLYVKNTSMENLPITLKDNVPMRSSMKRGTS